MCPQKFTQNVHENSPKKRTCHGQAVKAISSPGVRTPCCYEFKKKLNSIVQWLIVADCAMAESLARICIICLAIILELSPQDIVLHINVKSEIIPLVVVACGI